MTGKCAPPSLTDLERLYASLTPCDRDELLQELLVAAHKGADAMAAVLDVWLFDRQLRDTLDGLPDA